MEFRILGPLVVLDDRGFEVPLKGSRLRGLLALLVLHAGEVVAADRIIDELWGDEQPLDAASALQNQVSRLRAALRAGGAGDCIETRSPGYVLAVDPKQVDAHRFEAGVGEARELLDAGEPAAASQVLRSALSLWRGDVLADLTAGDLGRGERTRWLELRRVAIEDRVDADLAAGRHTELVGELEGLVASEPLRERRTAHLMLALYRSGRQADSLRVYQSTRRYLADELGIEPGADLRRLEAAVLAQDPQLDPPIVSRPPPGRSPRRPIPTPLSRLIGRDGELLEIAELVADHRLVTLVGPGGAGKTRLAVEVGLRVSDQLEDGAVMGELGSVEEPAAVVHAVARALGTDELRASAAAGELLAEVLGEREMLLLLDNCEHVLDEVALLVTVLLGRCPKLSVLATSRQGLGLPGEMLFLVPPLEREAAVTLFEERASAASADFALDENSRERVAEICDRLDGMPLAIELAASRVRVFSAGQLADRLGDRFRVVTGGARGALPRQQTLRAVVDWSYGLLDDEERRVFERVSVFAGGWSLEAAEAVASGDGVSDADAADIVGRLVDKSLVTAAHEERGVRFTMLQTLSEYGRERLAESGEGDAARRRLAEWLLREAKESSGEREDRRDLRLGAELDNVRVGLAWAQENDPALGLEIAARLGWFWTFNDAQTDGFRALSQGLARDPAVTDEVRARALSWAGWLAATVGEIALGDRWGDEAVELARRQGDPMLIGRTACLRAERLVERGRVGDAALLFAEARRCMEQAADAFGLAYVDLREGIAASLRGDTALAYRLSHRAATGFREVGDEGLLILALQRVGECADGCGDVEEASDALEEALARIEGLAGIGQRALLVSRLAHVRVNQERYAEALDLAEEAVALARRQSWALITGMTLQTRGEALAAVGRVDEAVGDLRAAIEKLESAGMSVMAAMVRPQVEVLEANALE